MASTEKVCCGHVILPLALLPPGLLGLLTWHQLVRKRRPQQLDAAAKQRECLDMIPPAYSCPAAHCSLCRFSTMLHVRSALRTLYLLVACILTLPLPCGTAASYRSFGSCDVHSAITLLVQFQKKPSLMMGQLTFNASRALTALSSLQPHPLCASLGSWSPPPQAWCLVLKSCQCEQGPKK